MTPISFTVPMVRAILRGEKTQTRRLVKPQTNPVSCPYGECGERLWVREEFRYDPNSPQGVEWREASSQDMPDVWQPPNLMPQWASRITLEIVAVRTETLCEISRADAKAEGFCPSPHNGLEQWDGKSYGNAQLAFQACWVSIFGKESWKENPLVWVIEFQKWNPT